MSDSFLLGAHVSIAGGVHLAVERAAALKCTTFQIFTSSPRGWRQKSATAAEIGRFRRELDRRRYAVFFVHMPYLPNLASPDDALYEKRWRRSWTPSKGRTPSAAGIS